MAHGRVKSTSRPVKVTYEPDEGGWHVFIPAIPGCRTWGRSLSEARRNIREALDACVGVHPAATGIVAAEAVFEEAIHLPADTRKAMSHYSRARAKASATAHDLRDASSAVAAALTRRTGVSLRDAAELLGLSPEGVRKMLRTQPPLSPK